MNDPSGCANVSDDAVRKDANSCATSFADTADERELGTPNTNVPTISDVTAAASGDRPAASEARTLAKDEVDAEAIADGSDDRLARTETCGMIPPGTRDE